ncbi:glycosyltransferase 87 family protein [Crossiella sp. CA-258035]|uniref:glycosyltransferase 87 family protein n=1 Tax=Crossiella sp. CA-258035 TaxID=2981138 RepID=UPI0024BCAB25|nr:glycosyltransferase 87 family protein [Crossiella sp. CA-258035]WHT15903.1 glycosyltransferase 87 family protein [Crossiella sp. CA-258035]
MIELRRLARHAVPITAVSVALFLALAVLHWAITGYVVMSDFWDLKVYRAGGEAVLTGEPLYPGKLAGGMFAFTYPPFAALLFLPLAFGPEQLGQYLVFLANVAALAAVVWVGLRAVGAPRGRELGRLTMVLTALLFWLEPVSWTVYLGQVNLLLMALVVVDLLRLPRRWRGVGVGIAAGIKIVPAFFILHLLLTRQYRAAATAAGTAVATVLVSLVLLPGDTLRFWTGTFAMTERVGDVESPMNQSLNGLLSRILGVDSTPLWLWLPLALLAAGAGLWVAWRAQRDGRRLLAVSLVGLTAAMVSPISWSHHWVWFVPLLIGLPPLLVDGVAVRAAGVFAALLSFAWPLHFFDGHRMDLPPLGLIGLPAAGGLELLYQNAYPLGFLVIVAFAARRAAVRTPVR